VSDSELSEGIPAFKTQERPFLLEELTPRELDVLSLLTEGLTNKAIAQRLGISEYTVKFHVNTIFRKLGAQSRTEAAVRAARLGLIPL
jgi:DNA-binding NarL/FixJ family response regulator